MARRYGRYEGRKGLRKIFSNFLEQILEDPV